MSLPIQYKILYTYGYHRDTMNGSQMTEMDEMQEVCRDLQNIGVDVVKLANAGAGSPCIALDTLKELLKGLQRLHYRRGGGQAGQ